MYNSIQYFVNKITTWYNIKYIDFLNYILLRIIRKNTIKYLAFQGDNNLIKHYDPQSYTYKL